MRPIARVSLIVIAWLAVVVAARPAAAQSVTVTGTVRCAPIPRATGAATGAPIALPRVELTIGGVAAVADPAGRFTAVVPTPTAPVPVEVRYVGTVPSPGGPARLAVTDELRAPRTDRALARVFVAPGGTRASTTIVVSSIDCETFALGHTVLADFVAVRGAPPPSGGLTIRRWTTLGGAGVIPYTDHDWVTVGNDWVRFGGLPTLFHEFGHSVRHVDDGDGAHFAGDVIRYAYARVHGGCETFQAGFAFNEGWGNYWAAERGGAPVGGCAGASVGATDWTELLIAARLVALANAVSSVSATRAAFMLAVSRSRPGAIHTLRDFEEAYCAMPGAPASQCVGGRPRRPAPAPCPPGFTDDGLTCRLDRNVAKRSVPRGAGTTPTGCGPGQVLEAGLCYPACPNGFTGAGPQCVEACPAGFRDDGLYCAKPAPIHRAGFPWQLGDPVGDLGPAQRRCAAANPGGCEQGGLLFYPRCPASFHPVGTLCSPSCPSTMKDIGVSCQKSAQPRAIGVAPTGCGAGRELDAGLCYPLCPAGMDGAGPVCWQRCPAGLVDTGATCASPIIAK